MTITDESGTAQFTFRVFRNDTSSVVRVEGSFTRKGEDLDHIAHRFGADATAQFGCLVSARNFWRALRAENAFWAAEEFRMELHNQLAYEEHIVEVTEAEAMAARMAEAEAEASRDEARWEESERASLEAERMELMHSNLYGGQYDCDY
jgi:hypothetical protein